MTDAYVMVNCELGAETAIIEQLKELEQVVDVFETIGTHDMMVKLQAENFEKICHSGCHFSCWIFSACSTGFGVEFYLDRNV